MVARTKITPFANGKARQAQLVDVAPQVYLCGCCNDGCVCEDHANADLGVPENECSYHAGEWGCFPTSNMEH